MIKNSYRFHWVYLHLVECATNMVLLINDNYVLFSYMNAYHSCMLGHSYFANPDYLVFKAWIRVKILFSIFINLTGTNVCMYVESFLEWLGIGIQVYCVIAL